LTPIISLENIGKHYQMGNVIVSALGDVTLDILKGDFVAVAGPSGSGKTTMLNIIGMIDTPSRGTLKINGYGVTRLKTSERTRLRHRSIGFIFQSFNLMSVLNVYENVELPLLLDGAAPPRRERKAWVEHLLNEVGLADRKRHKPRELSGGQQQRVAIARALVTKPEIVIADEPTANLDSKTGETILALMKSVNEERQTTFVFSTHDPLIQGMADHVVFLKDGAIEREHKRSGGGKA